MSPKLSSYEEFRKDPWVEALATQYNQKEKITTLHAVEHIVRDLRTINDDYVEQMSVDIILGAEGRPKYTESLFKKIFEQCTNRNRSIALTKKLLNQMYDGINDKAGVRFACPYYDQIIPCIEKVVRPAFLNLGYATDLSDRSSLEDKICLDEGDDNGYRSFHFFVEAPTVYDIYGNTGASLVEVKVRT